MLATGSALETVLGLPLGRTLGQYLDWHSTFGVVCLLALLCMVVLWLILSKLPSKNIGDPKNLPVKLKNKTLLTIYLMTSLMVTAHFSSRSYIEPFTIAVNQLSGNFATAVLLVSGLSGIVTSILFGKFYDCFASPFCRAP